MVNKGIVAVIVVAVVVSGAFIFSPGITGSTTENVSRKAEIARGLTEKGVIMYGAEHCGACKKQIEAFGDAFQYIKYVDCDVDGPACSEAGIQYTPTWVFPDGKKVVGVKLPEELAELASLD